MRIGLVSALVAGLGSAAMAQQDPLSAVDWLREPPATRITPRTEPPITRDARVPSIEVTALIDETALAIGVLRPDQTGLPRDLWRNSSIDHIERLLAAPPHQPLPSLRQLLQNLLLTQALAPPGNSNQARFIASRARALYDLGAAPQATQLLETAATTSPTTFGLSFDMALILGDEDTACRALARAPWLSPDLAPRIFCLARNGDWAAAALTLEASQALKLLDAETRLLLAQFLEPELTDGRQYLPPPRDIKPLAFRIREAIGHGLSTGPLPLPYAHADLRSTVGWKAQLEAAERLVAAGVLPGAALRAAYLERKPAASGGVWDRVQLVQRFDAALTARDIDRLRTLVPQLWRSAAKVGTTAALARHYADALATLQDDLAGTPHAQDFLLLSHHAETLPPSDTPSGAFLTGLARGTPQVQQAQTPRARAIAQGFTQSQVPDLFRQDLADKKLGQAIWRAAGLFETGRRGDPRQMTQALALFRAVGLESVARAAAIEALVLEQLG